MQVFYKCIVVVGFFYAFALVGCKDKPTDKKPGGTTATVQDTLRNNNPTAQQTREPEDNNIYAEVDMSPMDMSYFPPGYPQLKMTNPKIAPPILRVIYGRPHLQGRKLFEEVLKYGQTWRLGANEATELNVFKPVTVGNKLLPVGRYTLYAIPRAGYWTIAVNDDLDLWGLKQDTTRDVVRVNVPVSYYNPFMEYFTMVFEKTNSGANLVMAWDDAVARLPIKI